MKSVFQRIFKLAHTQPHCIADRLEDHTKMAEQGIGHLKRDLGQSILSLAQVKAAAIRLKKDLEEQKKLANDYERRTMLILQRTQRGELDQSEAERLASEASVKKEKAMQMAGTLQGDYTQQEQILEQLQAKVDKLKRAITRYEHELLTLKARSRTAVLVRKINQQLVSVDSLSTIAMLKRMKNKVMEEEFLAEAYGELSEVGMEARENIQMVL